MSAHDIRFEQRTGARADMMADCPTQQEEPVKVGGPNAHSAIGILRKLRTLKPRVALTLRPALRTHLNGIPGAAQRRRIAQVQVVQHLDAHAVEDSRGKNVDPFGDFRPKMTNDLCPQQSAALPLASHPRPSFLASQLSLTLDIIQYIGNSR